MSHPAIRATALAALTAAAISGCTSDKSGECPTMTALVPASEEAIFAPDKSKDPSNLLYTVEIMRVKGDCDLDKKDTQADVSLNIDFHATRSPSGVAAQYRIPYFVAVTEGTERVLAKKLFWVEFGFAPGQSTADFSDSIASVLVNAKGEKKTYDYQVLVGLQLTKAEFEYNQALER
jgi:hypothetical protein